MPIPIVKTMWKILLVLAVLLITAGGKPTQNFTMANNESAAEMNERPPDVQSSIGATLISVLSLILGLVKEQSGSACGNDLSPCFYGICDDDNSCMCFHGYQGASCNEGRLMMEAGGVSVLFPPHTSGLPLVWTIHSGCPSCRFAIQLETDLSFTEPSFSLEVAGTSDPESKLLTQSNGTYETTSSTILLKYEATDGLMAPIQSSTVNKFPLAITIQLKPQNKISNAKEGMINISMPGEMVENLDEVINFTVNDTVGELEYAKNLTSALIMELNNTEGMNDAVNISSANVFNILKFEKQFVEKIQNFTHFQYDPELIANTLMEGNATDFNNDNYSNLTSETVLSAEKFGGNSTNNKTHVQTDLVGGIREIMDFFHAGTDNSTMGFDEESMFGDGGEDAFIVKNGTEIGDSENWTDITASNETSVALGLGSVDGDLSNVILHIEDTASLGGNMTDNVTGDFRIITKNGNETSLDVDNKQELNWDDLPDSDVSNITFYVDDASTPNGNMTGNLTDDFQLVEENINEKYFSNETNLDLALELFDNQSANFTLYVNDTSPANVNKSGNVTGDLQLIKLATGSNSSVDAYLEMDRLNQTIKIENMDENVTTTAETNATNIQRIFNSTEFEDNAGFMNETIIISEEEELSDGTRNVSGQTENSTGFQNVDILQGGNMTDFWDTGGNVTVIGTVSLESPSNTTTDLGGDENLDYIPEYTNDSFSQEVLNGTQIDDSTLINSTAVEFSTGNSTSFALNANGSAVENGTLNFNLGTFVGTDFDNLTTGKDTMEAGDEVNMM